MGRTRSESDGFTIYEGSVKRKDSIMISNILACKDEVGSYTIDMYWFVHFPMIIDNIENKSRIGGRMVE